jgi:hypothetical protein
MFWDKRAVLSSPDDALAVASSFSAFSARFLAMILLATSLCRERSSPAAGT